MSHQRGVVVTCTPSSWNEWLELLRKAPGIFITRTTSDYRADDDNEPQGGMSSVTATLDGVSFAMFGTKCTETQRNETGSHFAIVVLWTEPMFAKSDLLSAPITIFSVFANTGCGLYIVSKSDGSRYLRRVSLEELETIIASGWRQIP